MLGLTVWSSRWLRPKTERHAALRRVRLKHAQFQGSNLPPKEKLEGKAGAGPGTAEQNKE
jgi:hypothetical protein